MYQKLKALFTSLTAPEQNTVLPQPAAPTLPPELETAFDRPIAQIPRGFFDRLNKDRNPHLWL
jgi:hypothetical protein